MKKSRQSPRRKKTALREPWLQSVPRGEISSGDLLRAFAVIGPDDGEKAIIADLLGFVWVGTEHRRKSQSIRRDAPQSQFEPFRKPDPRPLIPSAPAALVTSQSGTKIKIEGPTKLNRQAPEWLSGRIPVPVRRQVRAQASKTPAPLFFPKWTSTILATSLSTPDLHAPIDVGRLVEQVASGEILNEIPRLRRGTLARGVQVIFDVGEGMLPFRSDQRQMVQHIQRTFGRYNMQVVECKGIPIKNSSRRGTADQLRPVTEFRAGVPILVLSDLGIGSRAGPPSDSQWSTFATLARNAGCRITAFIPYGRSRWPKWLKRSMRLIHWDRH